MVATAGYQAGAESNDLELSYLQEVNWGVLPIGQFQGLRNMGETLRGQKSRGRPGEYNPNAEAAANVTQQLGASGAINIAMSFGTFDDLIAGLLRSEWSATIAVLASTNDMTMNAATGKLTSTTAGKFDSVVAGRWYNTRGWVTNSGQNNGPIYVASKTSGTELVITAGRTLVNEVSGTGVALRGSSITNAKVFKSFHVQKKLGPGLFFRYPGSFIAGGSLSFDLNNFLSGSFNLLSQAEDDYVTNASTGLILPAPTGRVHDNVAGFGGGFLDGVRIGSALTSITAQITNDGAGADYGMGSPRAVGMRMGTFTGSGSLQSFFRDFSLYQRFDNETLGKVQAVTLDDQGQGYAITYLRGGLMNPQINAGQQNTAVMSTFDLEGNPQPGGGTIQIDRLPIA